MKNLLTVTALSLAAACATPGMIPMEPYVTRSIDRVLTRHDEYVNTDPALTTSEVDAYLGQSAAVRVTVVLGEVDAVFLLALLDPVMDRHDDFIRGDAGLDLAERDIYLNSTVRIRSLLESQINPTRVLYDGRYSSVYRSNGGLRGSYGSPPRCHTR